MNKNIKPPRDLASLSFLLIHIQTKIQGRLPVVHLAGHFDTAGNEDWTTSPLIRGHPVLLPEAQSRELLPFSLSDIRYQKPARRELHDSFFCLSQAFFFFLLFSIAKHKKRWIYSWIPSTGRLVAFVRLSFPLWKHARKESRRMRQVWATLQLWPRASFVLRGCSGYALEGIRTMWHKSYSRARRHLFSRVWSHSSWKAAHCWLW